MRHCSVHGGWVLEGDAVVLRAVVTGSGPGVMVYACHQCVRDEGLVPRASAYVGRRDGAPSPVGAT